MNIIYSLLVAALFIGFWIFNSKRTTNISQKEDYSNVWSTTKILKVGFGGLAIYLSLVFLLVITN